MKNRPKIVIFHCFFTKNFPKFLLPRNPPRGEPLQAFRLVQKIPPLPRPCHRMVLIWKKSILAGGPDLKKFRVWLVVLIWKNRFWQGGPGLKKFRFWLGLLDVIPPPNLRPCQCMHKGSWRRGLDLYRFQRCLAKSTLNFIEILKYSVGMNIFTIATTARTACDREPPPSYAFSASATPYTVRARTLCLSITWFRRRVGLLHFFAHCVFWIGRGRVRGSAARNNEKGGETLFINEFFNFVSLCLRRSLHSLRGSATPLPHSAPYVSPH